MGFDALLAAPVEHFLSLSLLLSLAAAMLKGAVIRDLDMFQQFTLDTNSVRDEAKLKVC